MDSLINNNGENMFNKKYDILKKYALYKATGHDIICQALVKFMNNKQMGLVLQMESNSKTR